jgi:hypothetical protein
MQPLNARQTRRRNLLLSRRALPRQRVAIILAVALAAMGLALARGSASDSAIGAAGTGRDTHPFPRTYHIYGGWMEPDSFAKYDMLVGYANYDIRYLRKRNPRGIFLLQPGLTPHNLSDYEGVAVTYGATIRWPGGCDKLRGGVNLGCIRAFNREWDLLRNADGTEAGPGRGWNLADPTRKGTAEMVAKVFAYAAKLSGLYSKGWNGVHSDNWIYTIGEGWFYGSKLDTDRDGNVDDYKALKRNWSNGLTRVGHILRSSLPGKVVGGNGISYQNPGADQGSDPNGWRRSTNYTLIEEWEQFWSKPSVAIATARRWLDYPDRYRQPRYMAVMQSARKPDGSRYCVRSGTDPNQNVHMLNRDVMRSMRWGLTLALMAGVYYEIYVGCPTMHETRWWYDEYDGGRGIRRRGYLGRPLSPPRGLKNGIYRRDFAHGVALNNSTASAVTVELGGTFRKIRGTQNPSLNNGALVRRVTLLPHDGRIVLRVRRGR